MDKIKLKCLGFSFKKGWWIKKLSLGNYAFQTIMDDGKTAYTRIGFRFKNQNKPHLQFLNDNWLKAATAVVETNQNSVAITFGVSELFLEAKRELDSQVSMIAKDLQYRGVSAANKRRENVRIWQQILNLLKGERISIKPEIMLKAIRREQVLRKRYYQMWKLDPDIIEYRKKLLEELIQKLEQEIIKNQPLTLF